MMFKHILLVGLGGAVGSIARYICQKYLNNAFPDAFPMGTFLVNISGCPGYRNVVRADSELLDLYH
jgi:CrcB protein